MKNNNSFSIESNPTYFESIIQHSNDAIIGKTLDGIITSWNKAAERLYGYKAKEIIGKSILTIVPEDRKNEIDDILNRIRKGQKIEQHETIRVTKKGVHLQISVTISPILDGKKNVIGAAAIARDITLQRTILRQQEFMIHASSVLNSSLNYKKTLQSVAELAITYLADWCAIDLMSGPRDVTLVAVAHIDPKKVEWAREIRESAPVDFDAPTGVGHVLLTGKSELYPYISDELLQMSLKNEEDFELVKKIGMKSVMFVPIIIRGQVRGAITFVSSTQDNLFDKQTLRLAEDLARRSAQAIDNALLFKQAKDEIEERKKVENALRESEHKFSKLFNSSIIGVAVGTLNGEMLEVNQTFLHMLGYTRADFETGIIPTQALTPDKWLEGDAKAIEELRHFGESSTWEKEFIRKDGSVVPVLLGSTMLDAKKEVVLTFILDISEQKEIERRKDDFISVASHELKTPITSMKVFTQLLARRFDQQADEPTLSLVNKLDIQLNKLVVLIGDLLDVSRIHAGKLELRLEEFRLDELIKETVESLEQTTKHTFVLKNIKPVLVAADKERIGQVLTNFMTNAIKYSPDHKDIVVELAKTQSTVSVGVIDYGIGISKEEQKKIFDRFYQAKGSSTSTFPGLGMGLYICAEIIQRHSGRISVESDKNKGSHFTFTIPLHQSFKNA